MTRVADTPGMAIYPDTTGQGRYRPLPPHTTPTDGPAEGYGLAPLPPTIPRASQIRHAVPADPPTPGAWLDEDLLPPVDQPEPVRAWVTIGDPPAGQPAWLHVTRWRWWTRPRGVRR